MRSRSISDLHAQQGVVVEHALQPSPHNAISRKRTVGYSAVHHDHSNVSLSAFPKEVWPDLRFRDQNELGIHVIQGSADGARKVNGKVEDVICQPAVRASSCPAGVIVEMTTGWSRMGRPEFLEQFLNRFHFTHGYGMYPDTALKLGNLEEIPDGL